MNSSRLKKRGSGRTTGGSRNEDGCRWTKVGRSSLDLVSSPLQDSSDTGHWQGALRFLANTRVGQGAGMREGQWATDKCLIDGSGSMTRMVKAVSAEVQELLLERACHMTAASMRTNWPSRWHSHFRWERHGRHLCQCPVEALAAGVNIGSLRTAAVPTASCYQSSVAGSVSKP